MNMSSTVSTDLPPPPPSESTETATTSPRASLKRGGSVANFNENPLPQNAPGEVNSES